MSVERRETSHFPKKRKAEKEEPIDMKKRILPALLALCMVMALLPATVFATVFAANCTGSADVENCEAATHTGACPKAACQLEGCTAEAALITPMVPASTPGRVLVLT